MIDDFLTYLVLGLSGVLLLHAAIAGMYWLAILSPAIAIMVVALGLGLGLILWR